MKRNMHIVCGLLIALAMAWPAIGQDALEAFQGYIRSDLQLISQESKAEWSPRWTGPIQAATILAWFYDQGYGAFLRDFNGDGEIDERDTIELAHDFGTGLMRADTPVGTTDPRLVIGLARYVADLYPGEFVLKIYDEGFPTEFNAEGSTPFSPEAIPGIELRLMGEPTLEAYEYELETAEGVIVGLSQGEGRNDYLSGRSYLYEQTPQGHTPVDLAWAEEDRFTPGNQGRVLETLAREAGQLEFDYRTGWTPVEFMLALSPIDTPDFSEMEYGCPPDAIANHVTLNSTPHGDIEIEECVIRDGDLDIYVWIVTNISFVWDGCGVCMFGVSNGGLHALGQSGPSMWTFMETPGAWFWRAPLGSCGFEVGDKAVFIAVVPGPTVDTWVASMIAPCAPPMAMIPAFPMRTTGPVSIDLDDCADIELTVDDHGCTTLPDGTLRITVWPLSIRNIGGSDILSDFSVTAFAPGYPGSDSTTVSAPVASGGLVDLPALTFEIPAAVAPDPACPITIRVVADSSFAVVECDEGNNTVEFEECCPDGPGDERGACCFEDGSCAEMSEADCLVEGGTYEGAGTTCATVECPTGDECPDLTVQILNIACDCAQVPGTNFFEITGTVRVRVTNIGGAPTPLLVNGVSVSPGGDAATLLPLNPGNSSTHTLDISQTVTSCRGSAVTVTAEVDPNHDVDECNENNNTDTDSQDCS